MSLNRSTTNSRVVLGPYCDIPGKSILLKQWYQFLFYPIPFIKSAKTNAVDDNPLKLCVVQRRFVGIMMNILVSMYFLKNRHQMQFSFHICSD